MSAFRFRSSLAVLASLTVLLACAQDSPTKPDTRVHGAYSLGAALASYVHVRGEDPEFDTEQYDFVQEEGFLSPLRHPSRPSRSTSTRRPTATCAASCAPAAFPRRGRFASKRW